MGGGGDGGEGGGVSESNPARIDNRMARIMRIDTNIHPPRR